MASDGDGDHHGLLLLVYEHLRRSELPWCMSVRRQRFRPSGSANRFQRLPRLSSTPYIFPVIPSQLECSGSV